MQQLVAASPLAATYATAQDRVSAYERLQAGAQELAANAIAEQAAKAQAAAQAKSDTEAAAAAAAAQKAAEKEAERARAAAEKEAARQAREAQKQAAQPSAVEQVMESAPVKSFLRSAGSYFGREITRSIFGTAKRR